MEMLFSKSRSLNHFLQWRSRKCWHQYYRKKSKAIFIQQMRHFESIKAGEQLDTCNYDEDDQVKSPRQTLCDFFSSFKSIFGRQSYLICAHCT